ncbi:hypothetical protein GMLC_10430 [Geomonas limicola]|uniref:TrwC relaxase domain-containing protein n=1 Tax=Geomonas limicola TaxID=2740186 RepID=A0A6V8N6B6_9BACT|nr:relaxase domain-containing protein [Geomonas limicola]GFO67464.1 hypothetical protein GMLC_10430 [Geomonas limicola]
MFVLNVVRTEDGDWKANDPLTIYQYQKSLGLLYRQELAYELGRRSFEVKILDRSLMFIELKGVSAELLEYFSPRRAAIEAQVAIWKEEGKFVLGAPRPAISCFAASIWRSLMAARPVV